MAFGLLIQMGIFPSLVSHDMSARFDNSFSLAGHMQQVSEFHASQIRCVVDQVVLY